MEGETSKADDRTESAQKKYGDSKQSEKDSIENETLGAIPVGVSDDLSLKEEDYEDLWQKELEGDVKIELMRMTKQDYLNICNNSHNSLQTLLADEKTSLCATFSLLFKRFRFTFVESQQLLSKVRELEGVIRYLESKKKDLLEKLDKRDAQERELRHSYMTIRNAIAETSKQRNEIEKERDDLKETLSQIPEEILKASADFSLVTASEEKRLLQNRLEEMNESMDLLKEDLKYAQKREDMFRGKYQEAKLIQASLRDEILAIRRDLRFQTQMKENAELLVVEKNGIIENNLSAMKELRKTIAKMKKEIKTAKGNYNRMFGELLTAKKNLSESERTVHRLTTDLSTRQFQIAVLRAQKSNLELEMKKKLHYIHSLKVEITRLVKERNQLSKNFRIMEEDFKKAKADNEKSAQTIKLQIAEIEFHQKEKHLIENDYKDAMKQLMKGAYEFRQARGVIKELQSDIKILELNNDSLSKDLNARASQVEDLENAVERNRIEKNTMAKEIRDLDISMKDSQKRIKALEQRSAEYECKIFHLKQQVQAEKEQYKFLNDVHREITNRYRNISRELETTKYLNSMVSQRNKNQIVHIRSLQDKKDKLEKQITQLKVDIKNARSAQSQHEARNNQLSEDLRQKEREKLCILKDLSDRELEINALKRDASNLASERDVLRTQLGEKMNEIKFKDEKLRDQQKDFTRVEQMLENRIGDIKLLKTEIENLRRTEAVLRNQKTDTDSLRSEINNIHRQLMEEKLKSKTMEEEFQKPQNVHRWRILEAEDPTKAHLIARNLKFQKDLVKKTDKLKVAEQELHDKNRQVLGLKQNVKKLVETKSEGDAWACKADLRQCKERIKCLTAEVAMYENLTSKQESELKELRNEINRLKVWAYEKKLAPIEAKE